MVYTTQVIQLGGTGKPPWICGRAPHILLKRLSYCSYPKILTESIFNSTQGNATGLQLAPKLGSGYGQPDF